MTAPVKEGDVLAGKFRVDRVLGVGGMGVVVAAHHLQLDEPVALKFLLPETLANKEAVARFAREAKAAAKIKSEHVARVSDVGTLDTGAPYMVMEFLQGGDLSAWLEEKGTLPVPQTIEFILQACEAIAEAHSFGIVHRDLKPANLFIVQRQSGLSVKVLDFGISKMTNASSSDMSMTGTAAVMGSPLYMSPEQLKSSKDVDPRSDIWALGIILYELLTGEPPFTADSMPGLVLQIVSEQPASIRAKRADVPAGLEQVIFKCLAKDRSQRYQSVSEFATALADFGSARSRRSLERITGTSHATVLSDVPPPNSTSGARPAGTSPGTQASWGKTQGGTALPKGTFVGLGVVALLGVGGLVTVLNRTTPSAEAPSAAPTPVAVTPSAAPAPPPPSPAAPAPEDNVPAVVPAPAPVTSAVPVAEPVQAAHPPVARPSVKLRPSAPTPKPASASPPPAAAPAPAPAPRPAPVNPSSAFDDRK